MMESCSEPSVSVKFASILNLTVLPEPIIASSTPSVFSTLDSSAFTTSATWATFKTTFTVSALSAFV